jgi:hypothetical protein
VISDFVAKQVVQEGLRVRCWRDSEMTDLTAMQVHPEADHEVQFCCYKKGERVIIFFLSFFFFSHFEKSSRSNCVANAIFAGINVNEL